MAHAFKVVVQSLTERTLKRIAMACLTDGHGWGMRDDGTEFYVRDLDNKTPSEQRIPKLVSDKACQVTEYEFGIASPTEPWLEEKEEWETMPELKKFSSPERARPDPVLPHDGPCSRPNGLRRSRPFYVPADPVSTRKRKRVVIEIDD